MCIPQTSIIVKSQLIKDMMTDQMVFINLFNDWIRFQIILKSLPRVKSDMCNVCITGPTV